MNLTGHLGNLLDIPDRYDDLILNEARNKISGTYIIVNGNLLHVSGIGRNIIELCDREHSYTYNGSDIKEMSFYLPESGVYLVNGEYRYLKKEAKRQWKRSFCWSYYSLSNGASDSDIFKIYGQSPITMYEAMREGKESIYFNDLPIASKAPNGCYILNIKDFQPEFDAFLKEKLNGT